jgi:L-lactate dehydrogenase complex protein LldG
VAHVHLLLNYNQEISPLAEKVIEKISAALRSNQAIETSDVKPATQNARLVEKDMPIKEKLSLLTERATFAGSSVHVVSDTEKLKQKIAEITAECKTIAIAGKARLTKRLGIEAESILPTDCTYIKTDELADDDKLFSLEAAITDVRAAIAETGSIVVAADDEYSRLSSLTSSIHIAILWPDQLNADMLDFTQQLKADGENFKNCTIISGPSKTADIELKLVIGVHGPAQLHLIIMS